MEFSKVLPVSARVNDQGHLVVGGCDSVWLAEKFGTPLFVFDDATLRHNIQWYKRAFQAESISFEIIYAGKAFMSVGMCEILKEEGLSLDVSSGGEIYTAMKANFPPEKAYFHGNNKTQEELELALDWDIGRIIIDGFEEIEVLNKLAKQKNLTLKVMLRVTPGILPSTHTFVQTGQVDSKFGFGLASGQAEEAVKKVLEQPQLELTGFHIHIGSQIFALGSFAKAIEVIMEFVDSVKQKFGFEARELDVGGGLGIPYQVSDQPSAIDEFVEVVSSGVLKHSQRLNLALPKVMVEPGRSIVGQACVTLYRVGAIKEIPGVRTYVSVDGGMSDNLRPMLYGATYEAFLANRLDEPASVEVTIAGKHCESGDILVKGAKLPQPKRGDLLCTPATGAYGYAMANNYNRQPRPGVVLVKDGQARVLIKRESYDDLIHLDLKREDSEWVKPT